MEEKQKTMPDAQWLMETYRSGKDPERILAICRAALEESPLSLEKRTLLGQILQEIGRTEEACRELEHVEHLMKRGTAALISLADLERMQGRLKRAACRYIQALAGDSGNDACWSHLREISAALADALQGVFNLVDKVKDEPGAEEQVSYAQPREAAETMVQVDKEKPKPDQIMAILEQWLANIQQIKSKRQTETNP